MHRTRGERAGLKVFLGVILVWLLVGLSAPRASAETPPLPPGTLPLYVFDPVLPARASDPAGFGCFGACGPSCNCVDRIDARETTCVKGQRCVWATVSCKTHRFCRWHDGCYRSCDERFPGMVNDGSFERFACYRACDKACIDGREVQPIGGWQSPELNPGRPPAAYGLAECFRRLVDAPGVPYDGTLTFAGLESCEPDPACAPS